jgi:D-alanyl-lipoteichoic acid acyltransferase DltB (MBOAT superfamily)
LYIPLGGNRRGRWLNARNLMITMLLGGLWHGAAWTVVLWGAYHGLLLVIEHLAARGENRDIIEPSPFVIWGKRFLTFHLVCFGWLLFRAQSLADVGIILERLATWAPAGDVNLFPRDVGLYTLMLAWVLHCGPRRQLHRIGGWLQERSPALQGTMAAAVIGIVCVAISPDQPFIYFQF